MWGERPGRRLSRATSFAQGLHRLGNLTRCPGLRLQQPKVAGHFPRDQAIVDGARGLSQRVQGGPAERSRRGLLPCGAVLGEPIVRSAFGNNPERGDRYPEYVGVSSNG